MSGGVALAADGDLETTFNGTGKLSGELGGASITRIFGSVMQDDGKLVVAGHVDASESFIARFRPDGSLDPDFGTSTGLTIVDSGSTSSGERLDAVAIQPDGSIVAVGEARLASSRNFVLARLDSTGGFDDTFDGPGGTANGVFRISASSGSFATGTAITVDGTKVIFGGVVDGHSYEEEAPRGERREEEVQEEEAVAGADSPA